MPTDEQWWVKAGSKTDEEAGDFNPTNYFSNVRLGDVFTRTIPVRNEGTLAAKTKISLADLSTVVVGQDVSGNDILFNKVFELVSSIKSVANITGRFKVKIIDNEGLNIEETFISIKGETPQELMDKIKSQISNKVDTKKYMFTSKEDNTRFDITSKLGVNTGLNVEIEIL